MKEHTWKRLQSCAYRYSYTRLALNYYMYYECCQETSEAPDRLLALNANFNQLMKEFLEGGGSEGQIKELRSQVISVMEVLTAYTDAFQLYEYVLNRMERRFETGAALGFTEEEFRSKVMNYLLHGDDQMIMNGRIQEVVSQLPVRLTKTKFFSLMCDGLSVYAGSDVSALDNMLYLLRTVAMLEQPAGMKEGYDDLYEILEEFKQADYKAMDADTYKRLMQKLNYVSGRLLDLSNLYMTLQDLINDLYVLIITGQEALLDASEQEILARIAGGLNSQYLSGSKDMPADEITDSLTLLEGHQEEIYDRYLRYQMELAQDEAVLTGVPAKLEKLLSSSPFMSLEDDNRSQGSIASKAYVEEKAAQFMAELDQSFKTMSKPVVRAAMAKILSTLPVFFQSVHEIQEYINGSLDSCTDSNEKETCMELLENLMESENALV